MSQPYITESLGVPPDSDTGQLYEPTEIKYCRVLNFKNNNNDIIFMISRYKKTVETGDPMKGSTSSIHGKGNLTEKN